MDKKIHTGTEELIATYNKGIMTLTLNNPKYKNALIRKSFSLLKKNIKKINKDSKYKLLVIRGAGDSFCSGGNIKGMKVKKKLQVLKKSRRFNK